MPLNEGAINQIKPFASQGQDLIDVLPLADYDADAMRVRGHQPGPARRTLENRVLRQLSHVVAGLAQFVANRHAPGVLDDADLDKVEAGMVAAINALIAAEATLRAAGDATLANALTAHELASNAHAISGVTGLQTALNAKAPLASPALTGTPTAPTQTVGNNSTRIATTAFVQAAIAALINAAPGALDTLDELAAALGDDANFAATMTTALAGKQPLDGTLTALAGLALAADKMIYATGADLVATTTLTAFARSLLAAADAATARTTLGAQPTITGAATTIDTENLTVSRALVSDASGKVAVSAVTATELAFLDGVTSAIQTQLNAKAPLASPALTGTPTAPTQTVGNNSTRIATTAFVQAAIAALINAAPGALDTLDELAAALGDDANFAATMTTALAGKQPLDGTLTALAGLALAANKMIYATGADAVATTTLTTFARSLLDDVDAATARTTLGAQPTITGAATTIDTENLTVSRALVSDANGKVAVSAVTATELAYLDGVTSAIQTQLNAKAPLASPVFTGTPTAPTQTAGNNSTRLATTAFVSAHTYRCRAWACFRAMESQGEAPLRLADQGITSVTYNEFGKYTISFASPMPDANYTMAGWVRRTVNDELGLAVIQARASDPKTTSQIVIRLAGVSVPGNSSGAVAAPEVGVVFFR